MESVRTVVELKSSFIRAQVRILSENLNPQDDWRLYAPEAEEEDLSDKVADEAVQQVNALVKHHNRVVYTTQAIQHVAQQIASLYWSLCKPQTALNLSDTGVERTADLSNPIHIATLPATLERPAATDDELFRYEQLRDRLVRLNEERQSRRKRLAQLQQLQRLLKPFKAPQENIQANLITRDGELARELGKMRMLLARVGGRISQHERTEDDNDMVALELSSQGRMDAVISMI